MTKEEAFRLLRLARLAQVGFRLGAVEIRDFLNLAQQAVRTHPDSFEAMRLLRLARSTASSLPGGPSVAEARLA